MDRLKKAKRQRLFSILLGCLLIAIGIGAFYASWSNARAPKELNEDYPTKNHHYQLSIVASSEPFASINAKQNDLILLQTVNHLVILYKGDEELFEKVKSASPEQPLILTGIARRISSNDYNNLNTFLNNPSLQLVNARFEAPTLWTSIGPYLLLLLAGIGILTIVGTLKKYKALATYLEDNAILRHEEASLSLGRGIDIVHRHLFLPSSMAMIDLDQVASASLSSTYSRGIRSGQMLHLTYKDGRQEQHSMARLSKKDIERLTDEFTHLGIQES